MKILRILGILVFIAGIVSILISNHINTEVKEGTLQVTQGEQKVDQANKLFGFNQTTQEVGKAVTSSSNKKIAAGKETIAYYKELAQELQTGGIIGCVAGVGIFIISFFGKSRKRR